MTEDKIIPPYMQQNIERHKKRKKLDEIINYAKIASAWNPKNQTESKNLEDIRRYFMNVVRDLEKFKEEEL